MKNLLIFVSILFSMSIGKVSAQNVSPEHREKAPNIWDKEKKKETLMAKVKRYEKEGHKIAVLIDLNLNVLPSKATSGSDEKSESIGSVGKVTLSDETKYAIYSKYNKLLVQSLNLDYNTSVFTNFLVGELPENKADDLFGRDFWDTKYKSVIKITLAPYIEGKVVLKEKKDVLYAQFKMDIDVIMKEYLTKKQRKTSFVIYDPFIQAEDYYSGSSFNASYEKMNYPKSINEIYDLVNPVKGEKLANDLYGKIFQEISRMEKKLSE